MTAPARPPTIDQTTWNLALAVCTPSELAAIECVERGLSTREAANHLRIARTTFRDHRDNAIRKINHAKETTA